MLSTVVGKVSFQVSIFQEYNIYRAARNKLGPIMLFLFVIGFVVAGLAYSYRYIMNNSRLKNILVTICCYIVPITVAIFGFTIERFGLKPSNLISYEKKWIVRLCSVALFCLLYLAKCTGFRWRSVSIWTRWIPVAAVEALFWDLVAFFWKFIIFLAEILDAIAALLLFLSAVFTFISKLIIFIGKVISIIKWPLNQLAKLFIFFSNLFLLLSNFFITLGNALVIFSNCLNIVQNIHAMVDRHIISLIAKFQISSRDSFGLVIAVFAVIFIVL